MQPPPQRLIFPFIALMADWDLPLPSLSPLPSLASLGGIEYGAIWGDCLSQYLIIYRTPFTRRWRVACMPCGEGKGREGADRREELIDTPPSLPPSLSQSRQTAFLSAVRHMLRVCLAIWWFVVILKVNRYSSADDGGGPISKTIHFWHIRLF